MLFIFTLVLTYQNRLFFFFVVSRRVLKIKHVLKEEKFLTRKQQRLCQTSTECHISCHLSLLSGTNRDEWLLLPRSSPSAKSPWSRSSK